MTMMEFEKKYGNLSPTTSFYKLPTKFSQYDEVTMNQIT
jgi:hypothetical protein